MKEDSGLDRHKKDTTLTNDVTTIDVQVFKRGRTESSSSPPPEPPHSSSSQQVPPQRDDQRGPDGIGEARGGKDEENMEQEAANVSDISQGPEAASDISQGTEAASGISQGTEAASDISQGPGDEPKGPI
ncbi:hypothetical protein KUCAC02_014398 [Chaenocephalus aceratus]|uniref:Uncharacterized protein n=1 Tax=Chaenocephalus aceratus TaxID=36190 RepID=A0ACB9WDN0_CHAAC|nr:hypothetical protein KUCAC02_014398 [Chaenocephalus aceratus]